MKAWRLPRPSLSSFSHPCQNPIFWMDCWHSWMHVLFLISLECLPSTLTFAKKQLFWAFLTSGERDHRRWRPDSGCKQMKLILWHFFSKCLIATASTLIKQIKRLIFNSAYRLSILETAFWQVADEEMGWNWKKRLSRGSQWNKNGGFFHSYDRVGGAGRVLVSLFSIKANFVD